MPKTVELREKRAGLIKQARELWDTAGKRDGGPNAEDKQEFGRIMDAADKIKESYESLERLESAERDLDAPGRRQSDPLFGRESPESTLEGTDYNSPLFDDDAPTPAQKYRASKHYRRAFRSYLSGTPMWEVGRRVPGEFRDTILGTDSKGGYLTLPTQLANEIVAITKDYCFVMQPGMATVITLGEAKAFGIPQLTAHMADANWTTEVQAVTDDTTMAFARRDLTPFLLSKLSKVSIRMQYAASNIEPLIRDELGYKFGITLEKGFLTGSGSSQPLGVFTASANGVASGRDVSTGNTSTAIGADNLYQVKYSIKAPYRADPSFSWLFHRDAVKSVMLLKDSQNRYLWEGSLQVGQPDRLLGIKVMESEYAPNTFTTGLYVGILGAWRYYWVAQVDNLVVQRLEELYAGTNEIGFIGRKWVDGSPAVSEAFARVKLA